MAHNIDERLRDYQNDGLDKLRDGIRNGHRSQLLYAPTGAGKTEIAIGLMEYSRRIGRRSAMILDRIVLCDQTSTRLDSYAIEHGVLQSGHWRYRPYERIQVCSAQTLEKRGAFPGLDLLIIDEAHQTRAATKKFIDSHPHIKVVGLTATPFTKGLGKVYTNVVNTVTTEYLVNTGNLVPLRVFLAKEIDMTGAKKIAGEWSDSEVTERGVKITGDIVSEWAQKTNEIYGAPRKTIVFCASVAHGANLAEKFRAAGYNFIPVSYKDTDEYKKAVFEDFAKPDTEIHGLIAVDVLTKGFDVPDVMIGISARPFSKSLSSHVQQMGRIMRSYPNKEFGLWLDHSGNYLRFQDDWDEIYSNGCGELDDGREKAKKEPTEIEKKDSKCPVCKALWKGGDMCSFCGYIRQQRSKVVDVPGELKELVTSKKAPMQDKQQFYSELLFIAESRAYKAGWVYHKYKEKFGVAPHMLKKEQSIPSVQTMNWLKSKQIAYSKSK
jgi:superfamily II DNA or RNA helicase